MDPKTPVSMLQEFMVKIGGILPIYKLEKISGPSHDPTFEIMVRANSITAVGCAKSKQEAKQNAAKNALKQLTENGEFNTVFNDKKRKTPTEMSLNNGIENIMPSPVSMLQEIMIQKGFTPVYNLVKRTGESHNPMFEMVVRVNNVTAFGQGRTKRDAKHNAAKNALLKLENKEGDQPDANLSNIANVETTVESLDNSIDALDNSMGTVDNSFNGATFTPVSIFLNCCLRDGYSPEFILTKSIGPQHNPTFEYTVNVKGIAVTGSGKTKKEAKQNAAKNALDKLKEKGLHLNCLETTINSTNSDDSGISSCHEDEKSSEETLPNLLDKLDIRDSFENCITDSDIIHKHNELKGLSDNTNSISIHEYHNLLKRLDPNLIENAKKLLYNDETSDLQTKLRNVMKALEITYAMEVLPCQNLDDFGFTVKIKTNPIHMIAGIGKSIDEARKQVILNTIKFLEIMLK